VRPGLSDASYPRAFIVPLMPGIGKRLNRNDIARKLGPQALGVVHALLSCETAKY
jgi:hypothetical protein